MDPAISNRRAFIDRFATLCRSIESVAAVFLSGSYATDTPDRFSDVDLLVVATDGAYDRLFEQRWQLMKQLGELVLSEDFDGFGRDMLLFLYADGVDGEVDLHRRNTVSWVDPTGLVTLFDRDDVTAGVRAWPAPAVADRSRQVEWLASRFWRHVWLGSGAIARGRLLTAHANLDAARVCCVNLARLRHDLTAPWAMSGYDKAEDILSNAELEGLAPSFAPLERRALARGLSRLVDFYEPLTRELVTRHGLADPSRLAAVVGRRLDEVTAGLDAEKR